ncbi:hypothetical protein ACFOUP_03570 [Belliella kenyensis]|uniref:Uncharacterized protein n=1 Tax=Belliella kenyensis TaxID=1472724 RepID=A0ABV8EGN9_9BACT|nr:hypothetical protein [Belliella kenyensis]MCH7402311.1 hypothetical protein [Belliella kenyensis]MDN3603502.1 hypothetical protein [Belliella kenyensis]
MFLISKRLLSSVVLNIFFITFPFYAHSQYKLEKTEEFIINSLYPIEILDYYPKTRLYLGYLRTPDGLKVCLVNHEGKIIVQKVLVGEGPNQIATASNSMAFSKEGEIWVQSPTEIVLFDQKLDIKARTKYQPGTNVQIYGRMEYFEYYYSQNTSSSFIFSTIPSGTSRYLDGRDFITSHLIEFLDLKRGKLFELASVSERNKFERLDKSIGSIYFPIYKIDKSNNKLFLTTSLDDEIIIYDLNSHKLELRLKIQHGEFKLLNSERISLSSLPSYKGRINLSSRNHKIFLLDGGKIVLDYIREIPFGIYEKKIAENPTYHHFQDPNYHRLIVFDGTKQVSEDIELPVNNKLMTALPGNRLLFQIVDSEVEEDFIQYVIYEVVKK